MIAAPTSRVMTRPSIPGERSVVAPTVVAVAAAFAALAFAATPRAGAAEATANAAATGTAAVAAGATPVATGVTPARARQLGQYSGYEGREDELGRLVAAALRNATPTAPGPTSGQPTSQTTGTTAGPTPGPASAAATRDPRYDFAGRETMLGLAMTQLLRTLNHNQSYQHEMNDALVKMTLDHIMFAKRNGLLKQMVDEDINSQRQQLERVRKLIERTGNRDLAIVGIFEQTACFFQLVDRTARAPGRVSYRSPYRTVLEQTVRMGIHDLSEREIHDSWTVPRMQAYARVLGVEIDVTPWREDGEVTVSLRGGV